ncbi:MAG: hypothetical protein U0894_19475 [Pirellulales bacterium]
MKRWPWAASHADDHSNGDLGDDEPIRLMTAMNEFDIDLTPGNSVNGG